MNEEKGPGPIIKPNVQILLEDLGRFLRIAAVRTDRPSHIEATRLQEQVQRLLTAMKQKRLDDNQIFASWKPTPDNIKALPAAIRSHIEQCEKLIKENEALREQLHIRVKELEEAINARVDGADVHVMFQELKGALS